MFLEGNVFPTAGSLLCSLREVSSKKVCFDLDGEILHPVRFGTYADPMACPDQFVFISKDVPSMTAGELADLIQVKMGTNAAEETGGIDVFVHEMVHVMGMVSTPEKEAYLALSLTDMRVKKNKVTIQATSNWWESFEAYYAYWATEAGKAHINSSRLCDSK